MDKAGAMERQLSLCPAFAAGMVIARKAALTRSLQWPPFLQDSFEGPSRTGVPSFLSPSLFSLLLSSSAFISLSNLNGAPAVSCPRPWAGDSETETSMMQTLPGKGEPAVNIPCTGQMQGYSRGRHRVGLRRLQERGHRQSSWSPVPGT